MLFVQTCARIRDCCCANHYLVVAANGLCALIHVRPYRIHLHFCMRAQLCAQLRISTRRLNAKVTGVMIEGCR